jgi:hypothetical protein
MAVSAQKVVLLLTESKDWDNWYELIRVTAVRKGIFPLIDVKKDEAPMPLERPVRPPITAVKANAPAYSYLDDDEKEYYKILLDEYKDNTRRYEQQEKALDEIFTLISDTTALHLRTYTRDLNTPYEILRALRQRLEPSSIVRSFDLSKEYQALKHTNKHTSVDRWLMRWETTYAAAVKFDIPDIQGQKPLWDFLTAVRAIDEAWGSSTLSNIQLKLIDEPDKYPSVTKVIEAFRNNMRFTKASAKNPPAATFATFQGDSPESVETPSKAPATTPSKATSTAASAPSGEPQTRPTCVCGDAHFFAECPYLHESNRPAEWLANKDV